jgi:hypothetical protein
MFNNENAKRIIDDNDFYYAILDDEKKVHVYRRPDEKS